MTVPELVGTHEVAQMLGVSRQRVLQLAATKGFPKPVASLKAGLIWERAAIHDWMQRTGRA